MDTSQEVYVYFIVVTIHHAMKRLTCFLVREPEYSVKAVVEVLHDNIDLDEVRVLLDQALRGYGYMWDDE